MTPQEYKRKRALLNAELKAARKGIQQAERQEFRVQWLIEDLNEHWPNQPYDSHPKVPPEP